MDQNNVLKMNLKPSEKTTKILVSLVVVGLILFFCCYQLYRYCSSRYKRSRTPTRCSETAGLE